MNLWTRGTVTQNPYSRHAFKVARVSREVLKRRIMIQMIGQTRRLVASDPLSHAINGRPVTAEELNQCESVLLDPARRILEELLTHAAGPPAPPRVAELAEACRALAAAPDGEIPPGCASIGACELAIAPPFGDPSKE